MDRSKVPFERLTSLGKFIPLGNTVYLFRGERKNFCPKMSDSCDAEEAKLHYVLEDYLLALRFVYGTCSFYL
jgi:hypothetical protein